MSGWLVVVISGCYLGVLFAVAYWGDRRKDAGRSVISNGTIYALSLAVYATSWTFYGSVGRAADTGAGFLPIYLGPTIMAAFWWFLLRSMIRSSKRHRITSLADLVADRHRAAAQDGEGVRHGLELQRDVRHDPDHGDHRDQPAEDGAVAVAMCHEVGE